MKNTIPLIHKVDKHGKTIVYEHGAFSISVNRMEDPSYLALWHYNDGKDVLEKVGAFWLKRITKNGERWLSVDVIRINKEYRGFGMGKKMYQVLLSIKNDFKGIYSYLPDRANKNQVPAIYKALGGM